MAVVALDAGFVIGLLDVGDSHHAAATAAYVARSADDLRMAASAYAEVLVAPAREGRLQEVKDDLAALGVAVDAIDAETAEAAAVVRGRHPTLRLPDALVLAHAESVGADVVLTTDRRWRRVSSRVELIA